MIEHIPDLQHSIFDPSLLFSPTRMMEILLSKDDTLVAISESLLPAEEAIGKRFECRERVFLPSDFKGVDVLRDGDDIVLSQMAYLYMKGKYTAVLQPATKLELHRALTDA